MPDRASDTLRGRPVLTAKARRALGIPDRPAEVVLVPLLDLPARDDAKDRR